MGSIQKDRGTGVVVQQDFRGVKGHKGGFVLPTGVKGKKDLAKANKNFKKKAVALWIGSRSTPVSFWPPTCMKGP